MVEANKEMMQATNTNEDFERTDFTLPKIDKNTYPLEIMSSGRCKLARWSLCEKILTIFCMLNVVSPTMHQQSLIGMSARNSNAAFNNRRHTEVIQDSLMMGHKMVQQQQVLKDQMMKN